MFSLEHGSFFIARRTNLPGKFRGPIQAKCPLQAHTVQRSPFAQLRSLLNYWLKFAPNRGHERKTLKPDTSPSNRIRQPVCKLSLATQLSILHLLITNSATGYWGYQSMPFVINNTTLSEDSPMHFRLLYLHVSISLFLAGIADLPSSTRAQEIETRPVPLFDGLTLKGWQGDTSVWKVDNGAIVGSSFPEGLKENTFLIADSEYSDFVLKLRFRFTSGGSGIQIRSHRILEPEAFRVAGFQADIGDGDLGTFYEEQGRGTLAASDFNSLRPHLLENEWNLYEIRAVENHFTLKINGITTAEYTESNTNYPRRGLIALQLQAGAPMRIAFKDITIEKL